LRLGSVLDLLDLGYKVFLAVDAIGSKSVEDKMISLKRMKQEGARYTTSNTVIWEVGKTVENPLYYDTFQLVRDKYQELKAKLKRKSPAPKL